MDSNTKHAARPRPAALAAALACLLLLAGCAAHNDPEPEPEPAAPQELAAQIPAPEVRSAEPAAPFPARCWGGVSSLASIRLGMTVTEVRRAAPFLSIDPLLSNEASADWATVCDRRVRDFHVQFDPSCRVRAVWFSGPGELGPWFEAACRSAGSAREDLREPIAWRCVYDHASLTVVSGPSGSAIYRLLDERFSDEDTSRAPCLLFRNW